MSKIELPPPPAWVRLAATLIRRLPAGRYRMIDRVCRRPPAAFLMRLPEELGAYSFRCDLRDPIAREVCFTGRYEPQETALVRAILRPGMSFVDVGANWGYFTLLAAHLVGKDGRVVSVEPDPRLFPILQENVTRNRLDQVTALQLAAAAETGTLTLVGYDESGGNFGISRVVSYGKEISGTFRVAAQLLDRLFDDLKLDVVDLLKMDIEGAEGLALRGLARALAGLRVRRLLLELHPAQLADHGQSAKDVIGCLRDVGYRGWTVDHSLVANRRAAYAERLDVRAFLRPFDPGASLDDWPHLLWAMPGLEALS